MELKAILYLILAIAIVVGGTVIMRRRHNRLIEKKMDSLGGVLVSGNAQFGFYNVGPYKWVARHQTVYKFEYTLDGETKNGWVKFNLWGEPDWRI